MRTEITHDELIELYNDMLNECTDKMVIGYIKFEPARVLEELDPIAYNCGLSDYYDCLSDEYLCEDME